MTLRNDVLTALAGLSAPGGGALVPLMQDHDLSVEGGKVVLSLAIRPKDASLWEPVRLAAEHAMRAVTGVSSAHAVLTAERPAVDGAPDASRPAAAGPPRFPNLSKVRRIIAVASGKGGVGKSTTACNLGLALSALGLRVGILDADIYGPSMPKLLALKGQPRILTGRTLEPLEAFNCKVMSIGFLVDSAKAMIWRGPMVASAITQMLRDVAWGPLDVLVIDMPPGTGDAQLTLAQQARVDGAVIVSTPQDLALIDARRGVAMFRDVGVPILGLIENMSYFVCDGCGKRHDVFTHGGARTEAARQGVPFLGEIPLDIEIRSGADSGLPIVVTAPDSPCSTVYRDIARQIVKALQPPA